MLTNDDDEEEYSLDEEEEDEEMESASESVASELSDLQREGEMPIKEVLALYGDQPLADSDSEDRKLFEVIDLISPSATPTKPRPLLRSVHAQSESDSDCDYSPGAEYWRKKIQVGSDYQAQVPEGLSRYDDAPPYENEDRLLWDPSRLGDAEVEDYLRQSRSVKSNGGVPTGSHVRDDEHALFLLLQCGHSVEEALRRRRLQDPAPSVSLWSEEECRGFETGLRTHGKDFRTIQLERVRTRQVSEIVQFYYFWKRTERHDMFACKNRIEKKKYALHPGATDYMDRFLEEQEKDARQAMEEENGSSPNSDGEAVGGSEEVRGGSSSTNGTLSNGGPPEQENSL